MASTTTATELSTSKFAVTNSRAVIQVSCRDLQGENHSKTYPIAVLMEKIAGAQQYKPLGRTELCKDSSDSFRNPVFKRKLHADYHFEKHHHLRIGIYFLGSSSAKLVSSACAGMFNFSLADGLVKCEMQARLQGGNSPDATIIVHIQEMETCRQNVRLQFVGQQLDDLDFFTKSDPFIEISRANDAVALEDAKNTDYTFVHRTEVVDNDLNPVWKPFTIPLQILCLGETWRPLKVDVFDADYDEKRDYIGSCYTTIDQLVATKPTFPLINKKKKLKKKNYVNSGYITLKAIEFHDEHTFLKHMQTQCQLKFCSAFDFTNSNGMTKFPTSLHFIDPSPFPKLNQYELCLYAIGEIIDDYSKEKKQPAYGFGAFAPPDLKTVSFDFPLNLTPDPTCQGLKAVHDAYLKSANTVQQYGPTDITPVIRRVMEMAAKPSKEHFYYVLLIVIDGVVSDFESAKKALVMASNLPMTVVIVGVGEESFRKMEELDCKKKRLKADGTAALRDMCRFFTLRDMMRKGGPDATKAYLARHALGDLPQHIYEYQHGPAPPR